MTAMPRSFPPRTACSLLLLAAGCATPSPESRLSPPEAAAVRHLRAGDAGAAALDWSALATTAPARPALHAQAAAAARQAGWLDLALKERRAAAAADPADPWNRLWAARLLLAGGASATALNELGSPADPWGELTLGDALRRLGRLDDALAAYTRARDADPALALAEQRRGETLVALSRTADAVAAYTAALARDPSTTHLQVRLARLEAATGHPDAAYERYRKLLLVDAGNPAAQTEKKRLATAEPDLAKKEQQVEVQKRLDWSAASARSVPPLPPAPLTPIAVGIVTGVTDFRIRCASPCVLSGTDTGREIPAQTEVVGRVTQGHLSLSWSGAGAERESGVRLTPVDRAATFAVFNIHFEKGAYWSEEETRQYRGSLEVDIAGNAINLVNHVPLEDYLLSVVPSEMPHEWPLEALKAQAVAARTETISKLRRHQKEGFNVCATQHCAVYQGITKEYAATEEAVRETRGEVLLRANGEPLDAVYAGNCGGWGSSAAEIWGSGATELPAVCDLTPAGATPWSDMPVNPDERERWLLARPPAWCAHREYSASYRWTRAYDAAELSEWAHRRYGTGLLKEVRVRAMTREGWVTEVEFSGDRATKVVKKDGIRAAFGMIRSNQFTLEHLAAEGGVPEQYIIYGAGWGHGAGMCQDGAFGLAQHGEPYRRILAHYFPSARLASLYP